MAGIEKRAWQNDASLKRDLEFFNALVITKLVKALAPLMQRAQKAEVEPLSVHKNYGALERLLKGAINEFRRTKDSAEGREALIMWFSYIETYLDLHLPPNARDFYKAPLQYLGAALLDLNRGLVRPLLERAPIAGRASDGFIEVSFKVRCVLAADELHKSGRLPGKKRSQISREEADKTILRRVKKAATAFGFSMGKGTIKGWRRAIREASADEPIKIGYKIFKAALADSLRSAHDPELIVKLLLGRITDPRYII